MTQLMEPVAPWLRDLNRFLNTEGSVATFIPPADVMVDDEGVTVKMDVPGLSPDEIEIELDGDTLTIRGERKFAYEDQTANMRRVERGFGRFERTLRVPGGLNPDAIEASLENGVLTLRIPQPEAMRPRRVEIRGGGAESQPQSVTQGETQSETQSETQAEPATQDAER